MQCRLSVMTHDVTEMTTTTTVTTIDGTRRAAVDGYVSAAAATSTFDLLTRKLNQYISRPRYTCDLILVKLTLTVMKILYSHCFLDHHLLLP